MVSGDSPAVARRRLRLALRRAREAKGFTQGQVAQALEWSLSKVNRIEAGEVTVSRTDLEALVRHLEIDDGAEVDRLLADARAARRRGWWSRSPYRDHLTVASLRYLEFESEATAIRIFNPSLVPGIFQTRAYAEIVLGVWKHQLAEADRIARVEVRLRRRARVLGQERPPDHFVILDESVLMREVGDAGVMVEQLGELLVFLQRPDVRIRVIPFAQAALSNPLGQFTILDFGDEPNGVLYRDARITDEILQSPEDIGKYRDEFDRMWLQALDEAASGRLIDSYRTRMLVSLDGVPPVNRG